MKDRKDESIRRMDEELAKLCGTLWCRIGVVVFISEGLLSVSVEHSCKHFLSISTAVKNTDVELYCGGGHSLMLRDKVIKSVLRRMLSNT